MTLLLYGFKPYGRWKRNISEEVVLDFPENKTIKKVVFPVTFEKKQYRDVLEKVKPDAILGLGMHPRATCVRIERRAVNEIRSKGENKHRIIDSHGPNYQYVTARLKPQKGTRLSYLAGKYVCNFTMYLFAEYTNKHNIPFAFLHIPKDYPVLKAIHMVNYYIDEMKNKNSPKRNSQKEIVDKSYD